MSKWLVGLFSDSGSVSMSRVLSLICVLTASIIALYAVYANVPLDPVSILCGVFLSAGITGKIMSKKLEVSAQSGSEK